MRTNIRYIGFVLLMASMMSLFFIIKWKRYEISPYNDSQPNPKSSVTQPLQTMEDESKDTKPILSGSGPSSGITPPMATTHDAAMTTHGWVDQGKDQYGVWEDFSINGVIQRMRWCPAGTFTMGCSHSEMEWAYTWYMDNNNFEVSKRLFLNSHAHVVTLSKGFWISDSTCTLKLWQVVMGNNPSMAASNPLLPVETASWEDTQVFLAKAGQLTGVPMNLPTEAQWEYACRAGTSTRFWFGDDPEIMIRYGNVADRDLKNSPKYDIPWHCLAGHDGFVEAAPVKSFPPNPWGIYDMYGNVLQWCADWMAPYPKDPVVDPTGDPNGSDRVCRGGDWMEGASRCRSASRVGFPVHGIGCGFRFVFNSDAPTNMGQ